jgi:hypothetical protein
LRIAASTSENHCQKQADADKFVKRSVHYKLRGMVCVQFTRVMALTGNHNGRIVNDIYSQLTKSSQIRFPRFLTFHLH